MRTASFIMMHRRLRWVAPAVLGLVGAVTARAQNVQRVVPPQPSARWNVAAPARAATNAPGVAAAIGCTATALAFDGQPVPGGGTLAPLSFFNGRTVNDHGAIAFFSPVNGATRNQGIFVADAQGLHVIAMGCGGPGGSGMPASCGDPTPIGGTFAGLFVGNFLTPVIDDNGDVLFLADVDGGSSPRALFLYRAAAQTIVKVAAVGDASPLRGTFGAIGPGSLNALQQVVFLASAVGTTDSDIFLWQNGTVTKLAAVGDPAPGGGFFEDLGTGSIPFEDGTFIPGGPVPSINDQGQIAFRASVSGGTTRGLIVDTGGARQWYVKSGDVPPGGGAYRDFQAPILNERGQIAFFADFEPTPGSSSGGWFAGAPGSWRKVLAFDDPVGAGTCDGLAYSTNPQTPIDDFGNVIVWTDVKVPNMLLRQEHLVVGTPDGSLVIVAKAGDPTPLGGTYRTFEPWPSIDSAHEAAFGAGTLSGSATDAHMLAPLCEVATVRSFAPGCAGSSGVPVLSAPGQLPWLGSTLVLRVDSLPSGAAAMLLGLSNTSWSGRLPLPFDLTLVGMTGCSLAVSTDVVAPIVGNGPARLWGLPLCSCSSLIGAEFYSQVLALDPTANPFGAVLSNAIEGTVGKR